ncbi:MAG: hypothetical protein MI922_00595, partial [Bacteroidales bacterium]|nr:hypothetical protein [Bacteroidales bacterium]
MKNCVVIDAWHKSDYNQGVVSWASKSNAGQKQTMNVEFVNLKHEVRAGKTRSHMYQFGRRNKRINNAHIKVKGYCEEKNSIVWYGGKGNNTISFDCSATTQYTISASAGNGGKISPSGNVKVNKGSNQTFSINANGGYKIKDVKVDNQSIGAKSSYTFNNVTSNHSISATFEPTQTQTYTISASAGANGSITPSGNITVNQGANQTFSISATNGYKIADVKVDNTSVGPKASYTFTNVTANHSIYASFMKETGTTTKTVNLTPIHDAFLQGGKGYNINLIRVEPNKRTGYLMFDLSAVDGTIKSAKLKLKCTSDAGNGNIKINLGKSNNWTEKNLNNNNKPAAGAQLASINQTYKVGSVYTWNLNTSSLAGGGKLSLIATQASGNDAAFGSKENAANKPVLEITYTTGGGVADCAGVIGGSAYIDDCGECVGGTTGKEPCVKDCAGVPGGTAYIDDCGECVGGTTGKEPCVPGEKDCAGVPGGSAYIDDCGDCVGGTTGKEPCVKDCAGVPGGTAYIDDCGDCVGGTTGKEPCTPGGFDFIDYSAYTVGSSHDGNQHDKDDILAAPMVIALLGQTGLAERLVHMDYSNHLGNNNGNMAKDMATSVNGACDRWGLPKSKTFDCQKNLNGAVNSIKNAINSATAKNRFYYACGGPMEVPWRGIDASNKS